METKRSCAAGSCLRAVKSDELGAPEAAIAMTQRSDGVVDFNLTIPSDAFNLVSEYLPFCDTVKAMQFAPSIFIPSPELEKGLILYLAIQFLPLRDLSAMALVSKSTRSSITTEVVVRAAYLQTGKRFSSQKSMDELYTLMDKKSIHIPSPLRLLRIATGDKCEFCLRSGYKTIKSWSCGVFACWNCIKKSRYSTLPKSLTKAWNTSSARYAKRSSIYDAIFAHTRNPVSEKFGSKYYVWGEHRTVTGERVGPIIAYDDLDRMANYVYDRMLDIYTKTNGSTLADENELIDEYITTVLKAPAVEKYNEFNVAYETVKQEVLDKAERASREKMERNRVREERKRKREAEQEEKKRKREVAKQEREHAATAAAAEDTAVDDAENDVAAS